VAFVRDLRPWATSRAPGEIKLSFGEFQGFLVVATVPQKIDEIAGNA
jgi:hypothetical protein